MSTHPWKRYPSLTTFLWIQHPIDLFGNSILFVLFAFLLNKIYTHKETHDDGSECPKKSITERRKKHKTFTFKWKSINFFFIRMICFCKSHSIIIETKERIYWKTGIVLWGCALFSVLALPSSVLFQYRSIIYEQHSMP